MRLVLIILAALPALPCLAEPWDDFRCPAGLTLKSNTTRDGRHER